MFELFRRHANIVLWVSWTLNSLKHPSHTQFGFGFTQIQKGFDFPGRTGESISFQPSAMGTWIWIATALPSVTHCNANLIIFNPWCTCWMCCKKNCGRKIWLMNETGNLSIQCLMNSNVLKDWTHTATLQFHTANCRMEKKCPFRSNQSYIKGAKS